MSEQFTPHEMVEGEPKEIKFHVAEQGLETSIVEVLSDEEMGAKEPEDFALNRTWYSVTVANEADKQRWIDLRNKYLKCCWTPNQDEETRKENAEEMRQMEVGMRKLEGKVRKDG